MPRVIILSNPRSGSCYLQDLLNCHPEIELESEILNDEHGLIKQPLETIQKGLAGLHNTYVGFKLFPEQLYGHGLHFGELVNSLGVTHVIVLWREGALDGFVSRRLAYTTGEWYATTKTNKIRQVKVDPKDFEEYVNGLTSEWEKIGREWPVDVRPIWVKFEELIANPTGQVTRILAEMSCYCDLKVFVTPSERQNPAPVQEKVTNYDDLDKDLREKTLEVDKILWNKINISLQIPEHLRQFAPDREPCMSPGGWRYRVAEPSLPTGAKQNAFDAIHSGSISSAGYWPKELAQRLRALFQYPVAQPCSNGFTALLIALQAVNVGEKDEVILPAMTMVAVPNAVHFLRAKPVFADNSTKHYNPGWNEYEAVATAQTKAVIVTHTYGVPAQDIELIARECHSRGWILIEDISECVGITSINSRGENQLLGTYGDFAIASLYANKIVHGGDGGFIIAKDAKVGKRLASIINHGFTPSFHFVHFEPAPNAKIHGIGAAIASGVLDDLQYVMKHRTQLASWYRKYLKEAPLTVMPLCGPRDTPWVFGVECASKEERTLLRAFLAQHGIETRDYFFALHLQPAYLPAPGTPPVSLPNAELLGSTGFYLPSYTNLTEEDVQFICNVVTAYFTGSSEFSLVVPKKTKIQAVAQIAANGVAVELRKYRDTGALLGRLFRGHKYLDAVKLGMDAGEALVFEQYDQVQLLLESVKTLMATSEEDRLDANIGSYFSPIVAYFESQKLLEQPANKPWFHVNLDDPQFLAAQRIPTTTDEETLQLLVWLMQERKPRIVWEIGCWLGHATALMAAVTCGFGKLAKIYACDAFKWQAWMQDYLKDPSIFEPEGKSFLNLFRQNLSDFKDQVEPVQWPYEISSLPAVMTIEKPELIYLDITQEDEDLEEIWKIIKPSLIPHKTVILFNGLVYKSIPFFTRHAHELVGLAKPRTIAKAFLYIGLPGAREQSSENQDEFNLAKCLKFHTSPAWDHHHDNLFCQAINVLREKFHSDKADIIFVAAVEETMCDNLELLYEHSWVGIIHSVELYPELFYTPDLQRMCTHPRYLAALRNCKGLFTLTTFQAEYLKTHLPDEISKFPLQTIYYPAECSNGVKRESSMVPQLMVKNGVPLDLIHVGSFARDFDWFFKAPIPSNFRKLLVVGDEIVREASLNAPEDVVLAERLSEAEYEDKLKRSVVFLTLKYQGAANTLILECIVRNVPILSPNFSSCVDYLGEGYPLFYDPAKPEQLETLLKLENIQKAITHLETMDKSKLAYDRFISDIRSGSVMTSVPPMKPSNQRFDVTLCICSYKRTHHLPQILESLWKNQDFTGTYEVVLWNNNSSRNDLVQKYARPYLQLSHDKKSLRVISSTENYYCSIRFAMASLMKGESLLICDDDIIPDRNFISFFTSAHQKYPGDVLCVRGHEFLPHQLNSQDPQALWVDYDKLRFRGDHQPEQQIHFVHADACLIPKQALREVASVEMPDSSFDLVDDYWMSFVLSHKFNRKLRKLSTVGLTPCPIKRTEDSDTDGLALHTRPEVKDARLRLYVHHMLQGWPLWESTSGEIVLTEEEIQLLKEDKLKFWDSAAQMGFNISSLVNDQGIEDLCRLGIKCVRIGAVGVGEKSFYELSGFQTDAASELGKLKKLLGKLGNGDISVVLTLDRRLACAETWREIAKELVSFKNVVGYDLINEPYTDHEEGQHWAEMEFGTTTDPGMKHVVQSYQEMITSIRQVDRATPIILEPTFWGHVSALGKFPVESLLKVDTNLIMSIHFYEPMKLTSRVRNKGRYSYPGSIPWYEGIRYSEETLWNDQIILEKMKNARTWAESKGIRIFLGEFGICRDIVGAPAYLQAVIKACKEVGMMGMLFSFRDPDWEAMDYEFGEKTSTWYSIGEEDKNPFVKIIKTNLMTQ